jgi:hypothetical protein
MTIFMTDVTGAGERRMGLKPGERGHRMLPEVNTAQTRIALLGVALILLTALIPLVPPVFICVPLAALGLAFVPAAALRRRLDPLHFRPALAAAVSPQNRARAALPSLHSR